MEVSHAVAPWQRTKKLTDWATARRREFARLSASGELRKRYPIVRAQAENGAVARTYKPGELVGTLEIVGRDDELYLVHCLCNALKQRCPVDVLVDESYLKNVPSERAPRKCSLDCDDNPQLYQLERLAAHLRALGVGTIEGYKYAFDEGKLPPGTGYDPTRHPAWAQEGWSWSRLLGREGYVSDGERDDVKQKVAHLLIDNLYEDDPDIMQLHLMHTHQSLLQTADAMGMDIDDLNEERKSKGTSRRYQIPPSSLDALEASIRCLFDGTQGISFTEYIQEYRGMYRNWFLNSLIESGVNATRERLRRHEEVSPLYRELVSDDLWTAYRDAKALPLVMANGQQVELWQRWAVYLLAKNRFLLNASGTCTGKSRTVPLFAKLKNIPVTFIVAPLNTFSPAYGVEIPQWVGQIAAVEGPFPRNPRNYNRWENASCVVVACIETTDIPEPEQLVPGKRTYILINPHKFQSKSHDDVEHAIRKLPIGLFVLDEIHDFIAPELIENKDKTGQPTPKERFNRMMRILHGTVEKGGEDRCIAKECYRYFMGATLYRTEPADEPISALQLLCGDEPQNLQEMRNMRRSRRLAILLHAQLMMHGMRAKNPQVPVPLDKIIVFNVGEEAAAIEAIGENRTEACLKLLPHIKRALEAAGIPLTGDDTYINPAHFTTLVYQEKDRLIEKEIKGLAGVTKVFPNDRRSIVETPTSFIAGFGFIAGVDDIAQVTNTIILWTPLRTAGNLDQLRGRIGRLNTCRTAGQQMIWPLALDVKSCREAYKEYRKNKVFSDLLHDGIIDTRTVMPDSDDILAAQEGLAVRVYGATIPPRPVYGTPRPPVLGRRPPGDLAARLHNFIANIKDPTPDRVITRLSSGQVKHLGKPISLLDYKECMENNRLSYNMEAPLVAELVTKHPHARFLMLGSWTHIYDLPPGSAHVDLMAPALLRELGAPDPRIIEASMHHMPMVPDASFDILVSVCSLYYKWARSALHEWYRKAKPGAEVHLIRPSRSNCIWSCYTLKEWIQEAGFTIESETFPNMHLHYVLRRRCD